MASLTAPGALPLPEGPAQPPVVRLASAIWTMRGEVPLPEGLSADEAFTRLDPLLAHSGTSHARSGDVVAVTKRDQLAQDPLSVVDSGTLRIEAGENGAVLRYRLVSRALLYCFLAPLLFLAISQLTVFLGTLDKPKPEEIAREKASKAKLAEIRLNPVDTFLGAPAPEKPKDDKQDKAKGDGEEDGGFSPVTAYVFAGIFAALYVLGRLLEPWLIRRLFQRALEG